MPQKDGRTKGPEDQRTKGPKDQGTKGPEDQGTRRPGERTEGPRDLKTTRFENGIKVPKQCTSAGKINIFLSFNIFQCLDFLFFDALNMFKTHVKGKGTKGKGKGKSDKGVTQAKERVTNSNGTNHGKRKHHKHGNNDMQTAKATKANTKGNPMMMAAEKVNKQR